ncbi:MAG: hypothetical protein [Siphoviridae sp. ctdc_1]|nr:MAG: hypothetical protein [Siphoviridae sp. ctdc_1]
MSRIRIVLFAVLTMSISGCVSPPLTPTQPSAEMTGPVCELSKKAPENTDESIVIENQNTECATKRKLMVYEWQDWYRDNFKK